MERGGNTRCFKYVFCQWFYALTGINHRFYKLILHSEVLYLSYKLNHSHIYELVLGIKVLQMVLAGHQVSLGFFANLFDFRILFYNVSASIVLFLDLPLNVPEASLRIF